MRLSTLVARPASTCLDRWAFALLAALVFSGATAEARPWEVDIAVYFRDEKKAHAFERYLKTGSGRAFSKRHL